MIITDAYGNTLNPGDRIYDNKSKHRGSIIKGKMRPGIDPAVLFYSRLTRQAMISIPADIRKLQWWEI